MAVSIGCWGQRSVELNTLPRSLTRHWTWDGCCVLQSKCWVRLKRPSVGRQDPQLPFAVYAPWICLRYAMALGKSWTNWCEWTTVCTFDGVLAIRQLLAGSRPGGSPAKNFSALPQRDRTVSLQIRPLIFLDLDDVLCLNTAYGGHDLLRRPYPSDLWEKLFSKDATSVLLNVIREHDPGIVLTTSWLRLLERPGFERLFQATGLGAVADRLHERWDAPQNREMSRLQAIEHWLQHYHLGEPFVVLDDYLSGTGLTGSKIDKAHRVVLCEVGVGLAPAHESKIRKALCLPQ